MDRQTMKKILKKIFCLPPLPTVLISIPSYMLVFYVLAKETASPAITYFSYLLSAYAMVISVTGAVDVVRWIRKGIEDHPTVRRLLNIPFVERFFYEMDFRTEVSLYPSLLINLLYAEIKLFSGIRFHSVWFVTLAVYYILLAGMRFSLLYHVRGGRQKDRIADLKICRLCGVVLLILDWVLTGIIILVITKNSGFEYPGMLIYAMALYSFYAVIIAVKNVIKLRTYKSPAISVAKVINLTAALVSMLSLETAMLTQFGAAREAAFRQRMSAITGACVSVFVLGMAVYIIAYTTNQLHKTTECREE
ncbi:MAG: hypothetical protein ACI39H_07015 [Lachnospiraceae bacterium]